MSTDNVVSFPASENFTPEQALLSALEFCRFDEPREVVVIGYDANGTLFVRSSKMSRRDALWIAEVFKQYALGEYEQ